MLLPHDAALAALTARVPPAATVLHAPFAALGLVAAADVASPVALPQAAVALRPGHAVTSLDLVGASAHAPVLLMAPPLVVGADQPLPAGADAVMAPDAVVSAGAFVEITETPAPGEGVRLAGHDLAAGTRLIARGQVVTPAMALAATLSGLAGMPVFAPRFRLEGQGAAARWLAARLVADGVIEAETAADLTIRLDAATLPALALTPGACAVPATAPEGGALLTLAPRFDTVVAAWAALLLPLVAARTGRRLRQDTRPLAAKIASAVGFTELVLLKREGAHWHPLAVGFVTLETLLAAEAFTLWPAGSEGAAAGTPVAATPLDAPLVPDAA